MKPRSNWVVPLTAVGLGLALSGCGGSSNESEPVVNLNDPAYQGPQLASQAPAPAPAPEPAAEPEPAEAAEPAAPFEAARPELTKREPATGAGPDEPSESEPGEQQPTELAMLNDSGPSRNNETSAMNEMLSAGASAAPSRKEETKTQGAQAPGGPAEYESGGMDEYGGGEEMGYEEMGYEEMGYEEGYPEGYPGMEGDGFEGDFGGGPGLDFGGGGGAGADKAADFSSPFKAADSFLDAVKSRNIQRLAEATALRAPLEADPKNRDLFQAILESSLSPDEVDKIASQLEGYKISGNNQPKSTGSFGVIVSKQDSESNATLSRTIELRKEKAGWKVKDISGVRRLDQPRGMGRGRRR